MRRLPKLLIVLGGLALAYAATSALWREPVSDLYARAQQHRLERELDRATAAYAERSNPDAVADATLVAGNAAPARSRERTPTRTVPRVALGHPLARLSIPRIGLRTVVVEGTRASDLRNGPGHYEMTALPGTGKLVAIAGHRTTFGAPFRHIDDLRGGDMIEISTVYGRFRYRVFEHEIVAKDDWTILRPRTFETLVLSACHPLYSARQRWVVYARLVESDREG